MGVARDFCLFELPKNDTMIAATTVMTMVKSLG
jgi:hypothetical protein